MRSTVSDSRAWSDFFASATEHGLPKGYKSHSVGARGDMVFSSFMRATVEVDGEKRRVYLDVEPHESTLDLVWRNTINVEHDTINFELIQWDADRALLLAHHGKIIGDVWIAVLDPRTLPKWSGLD